MKPLVLESPSLSLVGLIRPRDRTFKHNKHESSFNSLIPRRRMQYSVWYDMQQKRLWNANAPHKTFISRYGGLQSSLRDKPEHYRYRTRWQASIFRDDQAQILRGRDIVHEIQ